MVDNSDLQCPCGIAQGLPFCTCAGQIVSPQQKSAAGGSYRRCPEPSQVIVSEADHWEPYAKPHIICKHTELYSTSVISTYQEGCNNIYSVSFLGIRYPVSEYLSRISTCILDFHCFTVGHERPCDAASWLEHGALGGSHGIFCQHGLHPTVFSDTTCGVPWLLR